MRHSESIAQLAPALVAAQAELKAIAKDAKNPHFGSKFASLDAIIEVIRPALAKHGLAVVQGGLDSAPGFMTVETMLVHSSGEWLSGGISLPLGKADPQGAGAAMRYARRYGLSALLSIATEDDDDGNEASKPARRAQQSGDSTSPRAAALRQSGESTPASSPDDVKVKGKRLGDMALPELRRVLQWAQENDKDSLVASASAVINRVVAENDQKARRALGIDDGSLVKRAVEQEDAFQGTLSR